MKDRRTVGRHRGNHIKGHHAGHDRMARAKPGTQRGGVGDAVLQADHHGARPGMTRDQPGHRPRRAALDGDKHDVGICQHGCGVCASRDTTGRQMALRAVEVADHKTGPGNGVDDARPGQQRHLAPGKRQAGAGITADAAGASDRDPGLVVKAHPVLHSPRHHSHCSGLVKRPAGFAGDIWPKCRRGFAA